MKRAMADVILLVGATTVVFIAIAEYIAIFHPQTNFSLGRLYWLRADAFVSEFLRLDSEAAVAFALCMGVVIVIMARLMCQLPRSTWGLITVKPQPAPRRSAFVPSDVKVPPQVPSPLALFK